MHPLRVAIFGESFLPYRSGVTIATDALARGLVAAGHEVLLAVPRPAEGTFEDEAGPGGADSGKSARPAITWLPSYQGPPPAPPGYRMPLPVPSDALREALRFRPQIVHAQSPFVSGLMARRLARRAGAPLVFTHHTRFGDYSHYLGPAAAPVRLLAAWYLERFWAGCAAIVAPSTDLAGEIEQRLADVLRRRPPGRRPLVRAIATGLDLAELQSRPLVDPRPAAGWPADAVVVVSVGRLAREKSVDLLAAAIEVAVAADPRVRLLLIGEGPERASLERRATEPPTLLHLAGGMPRLDALALAAGSDLFAFTSATETQGLVLAEALARGLPVVALEGPGVRDSIRDGVDGIVVPREPRATAAERLGAAIAGLAADQEKRGALSAAALAGAGRFAIAERIAEIERLYREVLAHR